MIDQIKSFDYIIRDDRSYQFYINIDDQVTLYKIIPHFILKMWFDKFCS
jgi:hypothetical protein